MTGRVRRRRRTTVVAVLLRSLPAVRRRHSNRSGQNAQPRTYRPSRAPVAIFVQNSAAAEPAIDDAALLELYAAKRPSERDRQAPRPR